MPASMDAGLPCGRGGGDSGDGVGVDGPAPAAVPRHFAMHDGRVQLAKAFRQRPHAARADGPVVDPRHGDDLHSRSREKDFFRQRELRPVDGPLDRGDG